MQQFIFDANRCTGCNACQIACSLENQVPLPGNWRQVVTFNPQKLPTLPHSHLSIACNHCQEPPCLKYCPALAYTKDEMTGAVIIDSKKCIGCHYCSWVCPYDAPRYSTVKGVMEKCTFCLHRLNENREPACVELCPTAALKMGDYTPGQSTEPIPGFTSTQIQPAISLIPLRTWSSQGENRFAGVKIETNGLVSESVLNGPGVKKIRWRSEVSLVVFTTLTPFLVGAYISGLWFPFPVSSKGVLILSLLGMAISALHLGQKHRAFRAIRNWKQSWLSREIIGYSIFCGSVFVSILIPQWLPVTGWLAFISGLFTLVAIDRVYSVLPLASANQRWTFNSLLTGSFFLSLFTGSVFFSILTGSLKLILYLLPGLKSRKQKPARSKSATTLRLISGFLLPAVLWLVDFNPFYFLIIGLVFLGELIERCQFYDALSVISPANQMRYDLNLNGDFPRDNAR